MKEIEGNGKDLERTKKMVLRAIEVGNPIMLWGKPGIGKSSIVRECGKELGYSEENIIDQRLPQLDPTDLRGIPMPDHETGRAKWYLPEFWPERAEENGTKTIKKNGKMIKYKYKAGNCPDGPGILFLDEIDKATVAVKNASLQLVWDRKLGNYTMPNDWAIVLAGNRPEDGCYSYELGKALDNRMSHVTVEEDLNVWVRWALKSNINEDIIAFLKFKPNMLFHETGENAFPTPRTWEMASRLIGDMNISNREFNDIMASCIGAQPALEFSTWSRIYRDINPEKILSGEMPPNIEGASLDYIYALTMSVSFYLKKRKGYNKGIGANLTKFLSLIPPDMVTVFLQFQDLEHLEILIEDEHLIEKMKHDKELRKNVKDMFEKISSMA